MGKKRKAPDGEAPDAVHESRRPQVLGSSTRAVKKPRFIRKFQPQENSSAVNAIKKRIRDVKRKLEHAPDLPADIRAEDERALAAYEQDLEEAEAEKVRSKMIKRYHMVRFFERQKATRQLKKLQKQLTDDMPADKAKDLRKQIHVAEVDLNYTQYCPLCDPYIGILGKQDDAESPTSSAKKPKPPTWYVVEASMEQGTLEELRDRPPIILASRPKGSQTKRLGLKNVKADAGSKHTASQPSRHRTERNVRVKDGGTESRKKQKVEPADATTEDSQDGYASGGGFFEE